MIRGLGVGAAVAGLAALAATAAPAQQAPRPPKVVVQGTVVDSARGAPIAGAEVSAIGRGGVTWTDNQGRFRLGVDAAPDSVRVIAIGFHEVRLRVAPGLVARLVPLPIVLPELVTTGSRWTERVAEEPAPVTTVPATEITARGSTAVDQVVAGLPGIQVQPTQPAGTAVSIRGIGEQRVLVLVDGEPAPGVQLENVDLSRLSTYDAERVEVTKGPTSSEYGSDALGGVINIVTQAPPERLRLDLNATGGNLGRRSLDGAVGGTSGRVAARLSGSVRQLDWAPGRTEENSFERIWNVGGTVRVQASEKLSVRLDGKYFYERQRWPVGGGFNGFQDNKGLNGWVETALDAAGGRMRLRAFGQRFDYEYRSAQGDQPFANSGTTQSEDLARGLFAYDRHLGPHTLNVGAQYGHRTVTAPDRLVGGTQRDDQWEVWGKDEARYGRFLYSLGTRYTTNSRWGDNVAPSFGVVWEPSAALRLRGTVARGFRAPSFKETGWRFGNAAFNYSIIGNPNLVAEASWAFSGGGSWLLPAGVVLDVDVYRNSIRNLIDFFATTDSTGTVFRPENIADARTQGVEAALRWGQGPWQASAGYNYLDAKNLTDGIPLNRRARHSARLRLTRTWRALAGLRLDVTGTFTGDSPVVESGLDTGGPPRVTGTQAAFTSWDGRAAVQVTPLVEVSVAVDNVFDVRPAGWIGAIPRRVFAGVRTQWSPFGASAPVPRTPEPTAAE